MLALLCELPAEESAELIVLAAQVPLDKAVAEQLDGVVEAEEPGVTAVEAELVVLID